jgi:hypothetical protein
LSPREITRYILKFISSLPVMRTIEDKMRENDSVQQQNQTSFNLQFAKKFDQVKSSMKRKFEGMDSTRDQMISVIQSYYEKNLISQS